jgi:hypothetical protein
MISFKLKVVFDYTQSVDHDGIGLGVLESKQQIWGVAM